MKFASFSVDEHRSAATSPFVSGLVSALAGLLILAGCGGAEEPRTAAPAAARESAAATGPVTARYVRLQALSEVHGNPWTSLAELDLLDAAGAALSRRGWSVSADSEELSGENAPARHAIDGDANSIWHTRWQGANPLPPHSLTVDLGTARTVGGFRYLPRQVGSNGRIAGWRFQTSPDGSTWTLATEGVFTDTATESTVLLAAASTNRAPVLTAVADRSDTIGVAVTQNLAATDADGDTLSYLAAGLPSGLTIDARTGRISGSATATDSFTVTLQVSDGRGGPASQSFKWTIVAASGASIQAQYVRLEALSEINGKPWTSVAELNVLDASGAVIPRSGWTVTADSEETVGERAPATSAIDGDANSFWHTRWDGSVSALPHALTINLGAARSVGGFRYLPRQVGSNGRIAGWRFYTSVNGNAWSQVAQGTFADGTAEQRQTFSGTSTPPPVPTPPTTTRASRIAAFASGPLVAGVRWRAGEAVPAETVRRLASGQHLVYTAAGTTGSVEPVIGSGDLRDGRPVLDGTATAYVNGRVLAASKSGAPLVSSAANPAAAGLTLTSFATGDFNAPRYAATQGCRSISSGLSFIGHYCYANGPAAGSGNATAYAAGPYGAGLSAAYVYHANNWDEEFVVTDSRFGLVFANSRSPINVEVDGAQVEAAPTISSGAEGWTLLLDYQGVSKARTVRVVSAVGSMAPTLRGVALTAQGRVDAGTPSTDQMLVLGDSINVTVTPPSEAGAQMMSYWLQRYLGFGGTYNLAVGGSGYVSANTNTYNLPDLLANPANRTLIAGYAPRITHIVIGAGFNDRFRPVATVQAAALSTWRTLRQLLPNARITITDGWSGSSGPDANALALASGLAATFAQWGDANSRLVRSAGSSAQTAYVSGTGHAGLPPSADNSSVYTSTDAVHPSPAGARYIARRLADDIAAAWSGAY